MSLAPETPVLVGVGQKLQRLEDPRQAAEPLEMMVAALERAGLEASIGPPDPRDADALLCLLTDPIDGPTLEAGRHLRIVANMAAGTDNIDLAAARRLGIPVSNTPDVLTDATADLAFGLLLAAARKLVWGDRLVRGGGFRGRSAQIGVGLDVTGRTLERKTAAQG